MRLPLRIVPNGLGELADLKDDDDRYVAHCADPGDARRLLGFANGREALRARLAAARDEAEALRRLLRRFSQTAEWHEERRRLMRGPSGRGEADGEEAAD